MPTLASGVGGCSCRSSSLQQEVPGVGWDGRDARHSGAVAGRQIGERDRPRHRTASTDDPAGLAHRHLISNVF